MPRFLHVDVPRFQRQRLDVSAPWYGRPILRLNGQVVRTRWGRGQVIDDDQKTVEVRVRRYFPDPWPTVTLDDHLVRFGLPWRWYERAWMALPALLMLGGLAGLLCMWLALMINGRIFRSGFSAPFRYLSTLLVIVVAFAGLLDLAWVLRHGWPR